MKKSLLIASLLLVSILGFSQEAGIRFGDVVGNDVAVDLVFQSGKFNRIHADVSFGHGVGVEALWDLMYRPLGQSPLNWYVGVGGTMLIDDPFLLGVSGEIGLEYRFAGVPIALGLDWRPTFYIIEDTDFRAEGFGFNARWVFGQGKKEEPKKE